MTRRLAPLLALSLCACDRLSYHAGLFFHETGRDLKAVAALERFVAGRPSDPRAGEARVRLGELYANKLGRCGEARRHFEEALRKFPELGPWGERARAGLMGCPDYFPLAAGRSWVYGDTASRGKNMRLEVGVSRSSASAQGQVVSDLYAGKKKIRSSSERFEKSGWTVWRVDGALKVPVLKYPYQPGMAWRAKTAEGPLDYRIESASERVQTVAGVFESCLKVRETNPKFPSSWKYDYYAPGVGRVKTSIAGPGYENPNTELLKF